MAFIIKPLGKQTVTASGTATLYTVPAGKSALVNNIRMVNGDASAPTPTLKLFVKPSGATSRQIHDVNFTLSARQLLRFEDVVTLGEGDAVQLYLNNTHAQGITCVLSGLEKE